MGNNSLIDLNGQVLRIASENEFTALEVQQRGGGKLVEFLDEEGNVIGYIHPQAMMMLRMAATKFELIRPNHPNGPHPYLFATDDGELRYSSLDGSSYHINLSSPQQ